MPVILAFFEAETRRLGTQDQLWLLIWDQCGLHETLSQKTQQRQGTYLSWQHAHPARVQSCVAASVSHKLDMMIQACHPSTWERWPRGLAVQSHLQLPREFEASRGYLRPLLNNKKTQNQNQKPKSKVDKKNLKVLHFCLLDYIIIVGVFSNL